MSIENQDGKAGMAAIVLNSDNLPLTLEQIFLYSDCFILL